MADQILVIFNTKNNWDMGIICIFNVFFILKTDKMYGNKLRIIRLNRGMSQQEIAAKTGIQQNSYSRMESNQQKIPDPILEKMADILGVSTADIRSSEPIIFSSQKSSQQKENHYREAFTNCQKELFEPLLTRLEALVASMSEERKEIQRERDKIFSLLEKIVDINVKS